MISIHMTTACRFENGLLQKAVESVLSQDYQDFEFIICDDTSEDGTESYLMELAKKDKRFKIFRNPINVNSVAISLARCFEKTSEDKPYITWMFDDNVLLPGALSTLLRQAQNEPTLDFVFGQTKCLLRDNREFYVGDRDKNYIINNVDYDSTLVPNTGVLIRKEFFDKVGWYDSSIILRRSTDWDLFRRMIKHGKFKIVNYLMAEEYGELEQDSLRNTFTTNLGIMKKYCDNRDIAQWSISINAALYHPCDRIPSGDWTPDELQMLYYMMLEYFLSVGDGIKSFEWAQRLEKLPIKLPWWLRNLKRTLKNENLIYSKIAAGAYCGVIFGNMQTKQLKTVYHNKEQSLINQLEITEGERNSLLHSNQQLEVRNRHLETQLNYRRYKIADKINTYLKSVPGIHKTFKKFIG